MSRFTSTFLALAAGVLGACGGTDASDATSSATSAYGSRWQPALTCNGGAAALDVDPDERRHLQFVIRDPGVINYITGAVHQQMTLNRGNGRELIAAGWQQNGVFQSGDFHGFQSDSSDYTSRIRVLREGSGVRIVFELHHREGGTCTDWCSDFCCGGYAGGQDVFPELANWYFESCG
jgi:hypothetical protein